MPRPGFKPWDILLSGNRADHDPAVQPQTGKKLNTVRSESTKTHQHKHSYLPNIWFYGEKHSFADSFETMCHSFSNTNKSKKEKL